jgi:hypothetical protein
MTMEEFSRPWWETVFRPLIYSNLLSNIAFVVALVVLVVVVLSLYKLVGRAMGAGRTPQPMEELDAEAEPAPPPSEQAPEDDAGETGESKAEEQ